MKHNTTANMAIHDSAVDQLTIDLSERGIRRTVRNARQYDDIRFYALFLEYKLGEAESHGGDAEELDRLWAIFCSECLAKAPAWKIKPAKKLTGMMILDPGVREDLHDNYFHAALSVALAGNKYKSCPAVAWAAFNKHKHTGLRDEIGVIRFLLWAGFNPNVPDESGNYPIHYMTAVKRGEHSYSHHSRATRLLSKAGANLSVSRRISVGSGSGSSPSAGGSTAAGSSTGAGATATATASVPANAGESPVVQALRGMVTKFSQQSPGYWKHANSVRDSAMSYKGRVSTTPWCYASSETWALTHYTYGKAKVRLEDYLAVADENAVKSFVPAFLGTWRFTQGVYRFDPDLYADVIDTPVLNAYPREALCHLPEWAVFIETTNLSMPGTGYAIHGVGLHLDIDLIDGMPSPVFTLLAQRPDGVWVMPALRVGASADHLTIISRNGNDSQTRQAWRECAGKLLSLALWLCSEQPEIDGEGQPSRPAQYKSGKKGERFHASTTTRTWEVGVRIGAALRKSRTQQVAASNESTEAGQRSKYRGHVRRAHWHKYRYGKGRINVRVRWVSHMLINMTGEGALPTTIHAVLPANDPAIIATKGEAA